MNLEQKIVPFLWFNDNAEEAMNHYCSIFRNSRVLDIARQGDIGPGRKGSVLTVAFELEGQAYMGVNGGPMFKFTEAVSLMVNCDTQDEVDYYWERLSEGGSGSQCGWLKDKFGLSWQVVPRVLLKLLADKDGQKVNRVMTAMLQMHKLDIRSLEAAAAAG